MAKQVTCPVCNEKVEQPADGICPSCGVLMTPAKAPAQAPAKAPAARAVAPAASSVQQWTAHSTPSLMRIRPLYGSGAIAVNCCPR